jgi:pimeloyl-ACP methyl ester carboxylesterase
VNESFVTLPRGRLHYAGEGEGFPIVMLHGWPGFWFDYRNVLPAAAALGNAIAPDFFGFGYSDTASDDPEEAADEEALARDIIDLLDALDFDRALLVGHDIGSAVAPAVARLEPERVSGLLLLNPTHPYIGAKRFAPTFEREAWYQHFHLLPLADRLIDGHQERVEAYLAHFYERWAGPRKIEPDDLRTVIEAYARPGAFRASIAWYRARPARRYTTEPPDPIALPTIALWGDSDPMRPLEQRDGFERAFPNATSRILTGVGHFVPAEAPEAVIAAIAELLGGAHVASSDTGYDGRTA